MALDVRHLGASLHLRRAFPTQKHECKVINPHCFFCAKLMYKAAVLLSLGSCATRIIYILAVFILKIKPIQKHTSSPGYHSPRFIVSYSLSLGPWTFVKTAFTFFTLNAFVICCVRASIPMISSTSYRLTHPHHCPPRRCPARP